MEINLCHSCLADICLLLIFITYTNLSKLRNIVDVNGKEDTLQVSLLKISFP